MAGRRCFDRALHGGMWWPWLDGINQTLCLWWFGGSSCSWCGSSCSWWLVALKCFWWLVALFMLLLPALGGWWNMVGVCQVRSTPCTCGGSSTCSFSSTWSSSSILGPVNLQIF
ncbi:unnamed protein product [Meloidogyne enterolobii]|uniref:Uncharacterized protein n=1 Tax=Meloidogyne enterolobii TaxID=390850 RepID=A0ACB1AMT9_MELEN